MAISTLLSSSSLLFTAIFSQSRKMKSLVGWRLLFTMLIIVIVGCQFGQSQTFQYSRGWTNGKRSGGSMAGGESQGYRGGEWSGQIFDVPLEEPSVSVPTVHMNLGPQGRVRSLDYNQETGRKQFKQS